MIDEQEIEKAFKNESFDATTLDDATEQRLKEYDALMESVAKVTKEYVTAQLASILERLSKLEAKR